MAIFTICNMAAVSHLEFSKSRVYVTWPLSPCYSASLCKISLKWDNFKWRPFAILNFQNFHICSRNCHRLSNLLLCTKCHRNRMIFRWDMAISRFSRWRISAILNYRHPIMGSLKSACKTSNRSSIETIALNCLFFEKIDLFVRILATDRQTDEQSGGQLVCNVIMVLLPLSPQMMFFS